MESIDHLNNFKFLIHEHGISFGLLGFSLISFSAGFCFCFLLLTVQVLASLIKFISKSFVLFGVIINQILFLISFSDCLLLVYRETVELYVLILYSATLLNSLISSRKFFFVNSFRFSIKTNMFSANRIVLFLSFQCIYILLFLPYYFG